MSPFRIVSSIGMILWLSGGLQQGLAQKVSLFGVSPDFFTISICCLALLLPMQWSLIIGSLSGIIFGAIVGANMWQFVVVKLLVSWLTGIAVELRFQRNWAIAGAITFVATLITSPLLGFLTSQSGLGELLRATIISAVYNGVLALVVFAPIEKLVGIHND